MRDLVAQIRTAIADPGSVVPRNGDDETVTRWATRAVLDCIDTTRIKAEAFDDAAKAMGEVWGDDHGAGEGLDADIHLLAEQRNQARKELNRLVDEVEHMARVADSAGLLRQVAEPGSRAEAVRALYLDFSRELRAILAAGDAEAGGRL